MWTLECDGNLFEGKKLWLRPGKKFLFGRTKSDGPGQWEINNKTVSKQHLTVEIETVKESNYTNPRSRSRVILTDRGTKFGTVINGERINDASRDITQDENEVTLGKCNDIFRISWFPICLSYTFSSKELKADPLTALFNKLGPLDIKIMKDYTRKHTTHLIATKRNTSKGLQTLIDGKYIVYYETFWEALITATSPNGEGIVPLEKDFVGNFPKALDFLPPKGAEPTERGLTAYSPNERRQDMFDGYTFVFYEEAQYNNLSPPIFAGKGKALLRHVIPEETTVSDFVRYVKAEAGEKGLGEFEDGSEGKGVVVVRYQPQRGSTAGWWAEFNTAVALSLDHRLVGQNEFLDAILGNDASVLRRPLDEAPSSTAATVAPVLTQPVPPSQPAATISPTPAELAPPDTGRRGRSRRAAVPRFKGFEDDDEWSTPANLNSIPESDVIEVDTTPVAESQSLFVSQQQLSMDVDREVSEPPVTQLRIARKRQSTPADDLDMLESLAPNAARVKKRRMEVVAERKDRGEVTPATDPEPEPLKEKAPSPEKPKKRRSKKEIEAAAALISSRLDEEAVDAENNFQQEPINYDDVDFDAVREAIEVIDISVKQPKKNQRAGNADESDRWNDAWNGRKNFKRFKRRGAAPTRERERVIVSLEEAKKKDYGIGDEYWGDVRVASQVKERERARGVNLELERNSEESEDEDLNRTSRRSKAKPAPKRAPRKAPLQVAESEPEEETVPILDSEEELDEDLVTSTRRAPRGAAKSSTDKKTAAKDIHTKKRPAPAPLTKSAPVKRARQTPLNKPAAVGSSRRGTRKNDSSDDSDDDAGFGFRRR